MKRLVFVLPVLLFAAVAFFLFKGLHGPAPQALPSMLIDKPVPKDALPPLDAQTPGFTPADLAAGHVTVVNFFASWCVPCREEANVLPLVTQIPGVKLYGIAYKDLPAKTEQFLADAGNPFERLDMDEAGRTAIDWGVTGVPETFVIDGHGTVLLRYQGPLTPETIRSQLLPVIKAAQGQG